MFPNLEKILFWVLVDGGAGLAAYALIGALPSLEALRADYKRYVAIALAGVLGFAAYGVGVVSGLRPLPVGFWAWVEALIANIGPVLVWSHSIHAARVLSKKPAPNGS